MSDVTTIEADVPERYADAVAARRQAAADEDVVSRIWSKDGTLWAPAALREAIVDKYKVATTWGYGPRFLHTLRSHGLPAVRITLGDIDAIKEQI